MAYLTLVLLWSLSALSTVIDAAHPWPERKLKICWGVSGKDFFPEHADNDPIQRLKRRGVEDIQLLESLSLDLEEFLKSEVNSHDIGIRIGKWDRCEKDGVVDIVIILQASGDGCGSGQVVCGEASQVGFFISRPVEDLRGLSPEAASDFTTPKLPAAVVLNLNPNDPDQNKAQAIKAVSLHELGHVLGLFHEEEERRDRNWAYSLDYQIKNFSKRFSAYDEVSVMNYSHLRKLIFGENQDVGFSKQDLDALRFIYRH